MEIGSGSGAAVIVKIQRTVQLPIFRFMFIRVWRKSGHIDDAAEQSHQTFQLFGAHFWNTAHVILSLLFV